jgi:predicted  nucleic acid-binding Zn-ribbon protein
LKIAYESHKEQKRQLEKQLADLKNQIDKLRKKKDQNSLLDEKDNKDIKATITQEYDSLK